MTISDGEAMTVADYILDLNAQLRTSQYETEITRHNGQVVISMLNKWYAEALSEIDDLEERLTASERDRNDLNDQVSLLRFERDAARELLDGAVSGKLADLERQVSNLVVENSGLIDENGDLERQVSCYQDDVEFLTKLLNDRPAKLEKIQMILDE